MTLAQALVAAQRGEQAEGDGVEDGVGEEGPAQALHVQDGCVERGLVGRFARDQHRGGGDLVGDPQAVGGQAQQEVGAGAPAAQQLLRIERIHRHHQALGLERADAVFQVREGRRRQAADVDHVGAAGAQLAGAGEHGGDVQARRIDDLGEDPRLVARQVDRHSGAVEVARQILEFFRSALDRHAVVGGERVEVAAAAPGHHHAVEAVHGRRLEPAVDHVGRHQPGHLQAELAHRPLEGRRLHAGEHLLEVVLRQAPSQEEDAFHVSPR